MTDTERTKWISLVREYWADRGENVDDLSDFELLSRTNATMVGMLWVMARTA